MSWTILIVPGYTDSGPEHWQTLWEREIANTVRVRQRDWNQPELKEWVETLDRAVAEAPRPLCLVAHSLGSATVVHWADRLPRPGASGGKLAALLVAPVDRSELIPEIVGFDPLPLRPLPFPSTVVASGDDPYSPVATARDWARAWGSRFVPAGRLGHINSASGHGAWPEGRRILDELLARAAGGTS